VTERGPRLHCVGCNTNYIWKWRQETYPTKAELRDGSLADTSLADTSELLQTSEEVGNSENSVENSEHSESDSETQSSNQLANMQHHGSHGNAGKAPKAVESDGTSKSKENAARALRRMEVGSAFRISFSGSVVRVLRDELSPRDAVYEHGVHPFDLRGSCKGDVFHF
jgi:hypothetical protein